MHKESSRNSRILKNWAVMLGACLCICWAVVPRPALAELIELEDGNSSANVLVNPSQSPGGMMDWVVDGVDQMKLQWFWLREGSVEPEKSLDALNLDFWRVTDRNFSGSNDTVFLRYAEPSGRFNVEVTYLLTGGGAGSGTADMAEVIEIINTSNDPLSLQLFQYCDFDLGADANDDEVWFDSNHRVLQASGGTVLSETVVTSSPARHEAALFPDTLDKLMDALPSDLNNDTGSVGGDVTWAFQWNIDLDPGDTFLISKDKLLVAPEPSTIILLAMGFFGLLLHTRRRRK